MTTINFVESFVQKMSGVYGDDEYAKELIVFYKKFDHCRYKIKPQITIDIPFVMFTNNMVFHECDGTPKSFYQFLKGMEIDNNDRLFYIANNTKESTIYSDFHQNCMKLEKHASVGGTMYKDYDKINITVPFEVFFNNTIFHEFDQTPTSFCSLQGTFGQKLYYLIHNTIECKIYPVLTQNLYEVNKMTTITEV